MIILPVRSTMEIKIMVITVISVDSLRRKFLRIMIISFLFSLITETVLVIHFFFLFENRLRFFLAFNNGQPAL